MKDNDQKLIWEAYLTEEDPLPNYDDFGDTMRPTNITPELHTATKAALQAYKEFKDGFQGMRGEGPADRKRFQGSRGEADIKQINVLRNAQLTEKLTAIISELSIPVQDLLNILQDATENHPEIIEIARLLKITEDDIFQLGTRIQTLIQKG